jgi:hypothetical protein
MPDKIVRSKEIHRVDLLAKQVLAQFQATKVHLAGTTREDRLILSRLIGFLNAVDVTTAQRCQNRGQNGDFLFSKGTETNPRTEWRRGWDSNPRDPFRPDGFQDRCIQPLCHPSTAYESIIYDFRVFTASCSQRSSFYSSHHPSGSLAGNWNSRDIPLRGRRDDL